MASGYLYCGNWFYLSQVSLVLRQHSVVLQLLAAVLHSAVRPHSVAARHLAVARCLAVSRSLAPPCLEPGRHRLRHRHLSADQRLGPETVAGM